MGRSLDSAVPPRFPLLQSGLFAPGNEGIRLFLLTGRRSEKPLGSELPLLLAEARFQPVAGPLCLSENSVLSPSSRLTILHVFYYIAWNNSIYFLVAGTEPV